MPDIAKYAAVTLTPLALLLATPVWAGFAVVALIWLTLFAALMDHLLAPPPKPAASRRADHLSILLALGHFVLVAATIVALTTPGLSSAAKITLFVATASFIGQVSHPNAHELIHRTARLPKTLGAVVYTSMGFGHHVSAHRLVHHRFVATPQDPNTPHLGESFWRYLPRAWAGSFRAGHAAETDRLRRRDLPPWRNPYILWTCGALLTAFFAALVTGPQGLAVLLGFWALTGTQILLSDYIQHYGLSRLTLPSGRREPVAPHHSWNAPKAFSSYLMLNAPSHAEHHLHPDRTFTELDPGAAAPTLPRSLPVMAMLATVPPVWHRIMDHRATRVMDAARARVAEAIPDADRSAA